MIQRALRFLGIWLYRVGFHRAVIRLNQRMVRVILYHACEPVESDYLRGLGSNTTPAEFEEHLRYYSEHYQVLSLKEFESGPIPSCAALITFDDGYQSVERYAFQLLRARQMPAVIYLITDVMDNRNMVWVNELNWYLRHSTLVAPLVAAAFGGQPGDPPETLIGRARANFDQERMDRLLIEVRAAVGRALVDRCRAGRLYLDWAQAVEMSRSGVAFGCHTCSHPSLPRLSSASRIREMSDARQAIERHMGQPCTSVAYPFGDVDPETRADALSVGFLSAMEVGGMNLPLDRHRAARVPVRGANAAELFAEIEIVAPVKAWIKRLLN